MFLFKVDERYMLSIGLILTPGIREKQARTGDAIKIIRPDGSVLRTHISAIAFEPNFSIVVGKEIAKEDVPIGSEVWLNE